MAFKCLLQRAEIKLAEQNNGSNIDKNSLISFIIIIVLKNLYLSISSIN